jgi:hypothetical protein
MYGVWVAWHDHESFWVAYDNRNLQACPPSLLACGLRGIVLTFS